MLPRLQCTVELHNCPLAQVPVAFQVDKVQFGLKKPLFFSSEISSVKASTASHMGAEERRTSRSVRTRRCRLTAQAYLQHRRCHLCCGSALLCSLTALPPPCPTFNYPWCCEHNTDLFAGLKWDKHAILWAGKMGTICRFCCARMKSECYQRRCWAFLFQSQRRSRAARIWCVIGWEIKSML